MLKKNQIIDIARLSYLCYLSEREVCKSYINRPFNKNSNEIVFNKVTNKPKFISCLNTDCQLMTVDYCNHLLVVFRGKL